MDWNKAVVLASGCVVVIVLGACVIAGHNSFVTEGLLAAAGVVLGGQLVGLRKSKS